MFATTLVVRYLISLKCAWSLISFLVSSEIKELVSKQNLPDHADANEKLFKELKSWRENTDKQIVEISESLTSTQVETISK
jgi:hypothetical protein